MKKYILIIFSIFLLLPLIVNAETCNTDKISISSITIEDKTDNVNEIEGASTQDKKINLNLRMSEVGDNIKYKIVVKNDSNEDYKFDNNSFNVNSNYINYSLSSDDNSDIIKAKSKKTFFLKVEYKKEVPEDAYESGSLIDNKNISVQLTGDNEKNISKTFKNPKTLNSFINIIIILFIISALSLLIIKNRKKATLLILIACSIIIPMCTYALCKCDITIESKIKIDKPKEQRFLYGRVYDIKLGDNASILDDSFLPSDEDFMFNIFANNPVFFKFTIEDDIITGISIQYLFNNKKYSLVYDPSYYEENVQVLNETFGSDKCRLVNNTNYYCQNNIGASLTGSANKDGSVSITMNHFGCSMNQYNTNCSLD